MGLKRIIDNGHMDEDRMDFKPETCKWSKGAEQGGITEDQMWSEHSR
jgi:hypothetical protein